MAEAEAAKAEAKKDDAAQTERNPITVVSGANFEAFVDSKMPKKADDTPAAAEGEAKPEAKAADKAAEKKPEKEENHDAKRYQRLVEAKKKADAEAAELRRQNAELLAKLNPPEPADIGPEPSRANYATEEDFLASLKDWTRKDERRTARMEEEKRVAAQRQEKIVADWKARQDSFAAEVPDYRAKIEAAGDRVQVSDQVRDAIVESDAGPQILYYLADEANAEFVEKLGKMTVGAAFKAIGRLEEKLQKETVKAGSKSEPEPALSKAPAPITPLKGASNPGGLPIDAAGNWTGTTKQYMAARAAGKIK